MNCVIGNYPNQADVWRIGIVIIRQEMSSFAKASYYPLSSFPGVDGKPLTKQFGIKQLAGTVILEHFVTALLFYYNLMDYMRRNKLMCIM